MNRTQDMNLEISRQLTKRFVRAFDHVYTAYRIESVTALAESIGMVREHIYAFRKGNQNVTAAQCIRLCGVYGVRADWLFLGRGAMMPSSAETSVDNK